MRSLAGQASNPGAALDPGAWLESSILGVSESPRFPSKSGAGASRYSWATLQQLKSAPRPQCGRRAMRPGLMVAIPVQVCVRRIQALRSFCTDPPREGRR